MKVPEEAKKALCGAKITHVGYMTDSEVADFMWDEPGLVINLTAPDGSLIELLVAQDGEGNGPGRLHTSIPGIPVL